MLSLAVTILARCLLVALFLPFSALDKLLNFSAAVRQARQIGVGRQLATLLIVGGLGIEASMSVAVLTGIADRLAAFILAIYCVVTALLWKQFWLRKDFRLRGPSAGRALFWDFLKNLAVAGGFLMLALSNNRAGVGQFIADPLASSHPYSQASP